jgi:hypothetical protein
MRYIWRYAARRPDEKGTEVIQTWYAAGQQDMTPRGAPMRRGLKYEKRLNSHETRLN